MGFLKIGVLLAALTLLSVSAFAEDSPKAALDRLTTRVDELLKRENPPLYAWHLRSLRAMALSEYAKLTLQMAQSSRITVESREKEFMEYVNKIASGVEEKEEGPDLYLKQGRRALILSRLSNIDGSLQYMMVDLPKDWDPARAYPLSVNLHGTGPDHPLAYPSFAIGPLTPPNPNPTPNPMGPMISLTPWGRGNSPWRNDNERDLWEALGLLQTFAKVDPDRWYLSGHSAGADGAWAIVQHTPDLWAAVGMQSGSMVGGRPEWGLVPNMTYVPVHWLIGENDNLPGRIPDNKEGYELLRKAGTPTKLLIMKGIGHYPLSEEGYRDQTAFMAQFTRKRPSKFSFVIDDPRHPGVWGIRMAIEPWSRRFIAQPWPRFECEIEGSEVRLKTSGMKEVSVDLGSEGLRMAGSVRLVVNGKKVHDGPVPGGPVVVKDL